MPGVRSASDREGAGPTPRPRDEGDTIVPAPHDLPDRERAPHGAVPRLEDSCGFRADGIHPPDTAPQALEAITLLAFDSFEPVQGWVGDLMKAAEKQRVLTDDLRHTALCALRELAKHDPGKGTPRNRQMISRLIL